MTYKQLISTSASGELQSHTQFSLMFRSAPSRLLHCGEMKLTLMSAFKQKTTFHLSRGNELTTHGRHPKFKQANRTLMPPHRTGRAVICDGKGKTSLLAEGRGAHFSPNKSPAHNYLIASHSTHTITTSSSNTTHTLVRPSSTARQHDTSSLQNQINSS
jgi:TPP-dependent pyruvate/acetoin dehydrogenase alpha subunit